MFGLTEEEMDTYRDLVQDYAVEDVAHIIKNRSIFIAPFIEGAEGREPDMEYLRKMLTDLETIITLTATNMAYEYAYMQCDTDLEEEKIISQLREKYEDYVFRQFVKYGLSPTADVMGEIVISIMLELPYIYADSIEDESFDEDEFLEERLAAYTKYLDDNFSEDFDDDEDSEEED